MRHCGDCDRDLDELCFSFKSKAKNLLQFKCKECHKKYCQKHYKDNVSYYQTKHKKYVTNIRDEINIYKSSRGCSHCFENDSCCLDFHHVDEKIESISRLIQNCNRKQIYEEISKCIILCSNCHRKLHRYEGISANNNKINL